MARNIKGKAATMSAKAVTIQAADMIEFLEGRGFRRMQLPDTKEIVFGKRVDLQGGGFENSVPSIIWMIPLTIRVYTSIEFGKSRDKGKDAIRVSVWARNSTPVRAGLMRSEPFMLGGTRRVHRVEGWRDNLANRLDNWMQCIEPLCPLCNAPMVHHKPKIGGKKFTPFYGCVRYYTNSCRGTRQEEK